MFDGINPKDSPLSTAVGTKKLLSQHSIKLRDFKKSAQEDGAFQAIEREL